MFEKHQKVTWYKIFCVYKRKIGTEKPKKRLTNTNEMNQKFKNPPTPLAARGSAVRREITSSKGQQIITKCKDSFGNALIKGPHEIHLKHVVHARLN